MTTLFLWPFPLFTSASCGKASISSRLEGVFPFISNQLLSSVALPQGVVGAAGAVSVAGAAGVVGVACAAGVVGAVSNGQVNGGCGGTQTGVGGGAIVISSRPSAPLMVPTRSSTTFPVR